MADKSKDRERRPTVYDLKESARKKYPDKARDYYWIERYAKMASRIIGWEIKYDGLEGLTGCDPVLLLIEEEDYTTRSPAKKQAIEDWRIEHEGT